MTPSLEIGNGNWAVQSDSLLGYKTINGKYYPREMSVTRATTGTRVNAEGLVELVPYNLFSYSEMFENTYWTDNLRIVLPNVAVAPNGTTTADLIYPSTSGLFRGIYTSGLLNNNYNFSVFAKASGKNFLFFYVVGASSVTGLWFNLSNGTIGSIGSSWSNVNIQNVGNGWYRCSANVTLIGPTNNLYYCMSDADNSNSVTLNGTDGIYLWGAQLVEGSEPLDYLPTTTRLNIARIDYSTGSPALLVEPQRTNLFTYSEQFDNGAWFKASATITTNATIAPNGTLTADKAIATNTVDATRAVLQNFTSILGSTYSISVYVKAAEYTKFTISDIAYGRFGASFDLVAETSTSLGGLNYVSSLITNEGNGWYKCSIVATGSPVQWAVGFMGYPDGVTPSSSGVLYTGDGVSGVFIWGAQIEVGAYPTSYIPTTSASVTRNADVISKTGISSLIGQTEGVIFIDYYASAQNIDTLSYAYLFIGGTFTDNYQIYNYGTTLYWYIRNASGIIISQTANQTLVAGSRYKIALAYKSGEYALYINGVQKRTSTNSSAPPAMSQFNLNAEDFGASAAKVKNEFNAVAFWPTRLTNEQLAELTSL